MVGLTQENIIHFIDHPESVNEAQLSHLNELSKKYPFSGFINILLAKVFYLQNHVEYKNQLEKTAFTVTERSLLYKYIQRETLMKRIKTIVHDEEDEIENEKIDTNEDPELIELEKNILSAAINMSIQQESQVEQEDLSQTPVKDLKESPKVIKDLDNAVMPLSGWLRSSKTENIEEESPSVKEKKSFYSPLEKAKMSLIDNEEFVTETLAEIHVRQGNYPKAIKIYEKLILNFPEKKTFFASRIRFIKEKSNYT